MKRLALLVLAGLMCGAAAAAELPPPAAYTAKDLADRAQIEDVISAFALSVDQRQWDAAGRMLADQVELGFPADNPDGTRTLKLTKMPAEQFIAASKSQLPGYLHTQHMVTNPVVTIHGDKADVAAQMQLAHYLPGAEGGPFYLVVGTYDYAMARTPKGWKIAAMHVNKLFELGNLKLPELASARVKAGQIATSP